ncbi:hypothetical protein ES702_01315 [subsurface metagenome]
MNFEGIVEKARELSFSDSLSPLFNNKQIEALRGTIDVMERAVNKGRNWQKVEFQEGDDIIIFFVLDRISDHLCVNIGMERELKEFIRVYLQLSAHYKSCRNITGERSPMLKQGVDRLYELVESRKSAISASLRQRVN